MKYIDAERLKEWLEKQADIEFKKTEENASSPVLCHFHNGCRMQALDTIDFIDSLQQEQDILVINKKDWEAQEKFRKNKDFGKPLQQGKPETDKKEQSQIDWESEIEEYWIASGWSKSISLGKFKVIARYFIGLALYAKKED